ncbi:uncharacterized protein LOC108436847 isoform X2 [Pygocentrus nattereri]|uniref:uncharacterized protein LOC108436847 isoform X2 n=1 Tax=Pygocentrus nattereri TaxID=42514 RepID=UPI00081448FC|nr:uncharacterized protein LOC108436847 isoform X2 [Pygocentrus nattereri]
MWYKRFGGVTIGYKRSCQFGLGHLCVCLWRGSFSESGKENKSMKMDNQTITKDEFNKVLTRISGCVEGGVKEVFDPTFQWSMEQSLSSTRSSEIISSSPHGVERGEILTSPSERSSHSQRPASEITSCSFSIGSACSLDLMATSPFRTGMKSWLDETSKPVEDLRRDLKSLTMVEVSTSPLSEPLRDWVGITKDSIFKNVHSEVTRSMRNIAFPSMMRFLNRKTTFNLTNSILDHSLRKINSTLAELHHDAESHQEPLFPGSTSKEAARKLLSATFTKMQDVVQLCAVSDWLSDSQGSPVDVHEELEEMLPLITAKVVATLFESMLTICSEGTPAKSETPLFNFVQAVNDKIRSDLFKAASLRQAPSGRSSSIGWKSPSECSSDESLTRLCSYTPHTGVETARLISSSRRSCQSSWTPGAGKAVHWLHGEKEEVTVVQDIPINLLTLMATKIPEVMSSVIFKSLQLQESLRLKPCRERIMETIICPCVDEDYDPSTSEMKAQQLFRISCDAFRVDASKMVTSVIMKETEEIAKATQANKSSNLSSESQKLSTCPTFHKKLECSAFAAACDFVHAVTGQIKVSFEEELKLVDPFTDTALYTEQVRMVSEKVLKSTQATLKDIFVGNLFMRAQATMTTLDAADLSYDLLSASKTVVKNIIENITNKLSLFSVRGSVEAVTGLFLQALEDDLELLFLWQLSNSCIRHPEALSDLSVSDIFKIVADELITCEAYQQKEASVLKLADTKFIPQSHHERVLDLVEDIMLEGSSDLDRGKETMSASVLGHQIGMTTEESEKKPQTSKKPFMFPKIKIPKLTLKKWRNRVEPMTVVSQDGMQERSGPTDDPSKSKAASTSTCIPVPARKSLFSRVIKATSKVFRK